MESSIFTKLCCSNFSKRPKSLESMEVLDYELHHHFCNSTASDFSNDPLLRDFWHLNIVKVRL